MVSLLSRLSKYSFNKKSQDENILTETLAYLLQEDKRVRRAFLDLCFGNDEQAKQKYLSNGVTLSTQVPLGKWYIDLQMTCGDDHSISVENKIGRSNYSSGNGNGSKQIDSYVRLLSEQAGEHYLVCLVPGSALPMRGSRKRSSYLGERSWETLRDLLKSSDALLQEQRLSVLTQFVDFLEERLNMKEFTEAEINSSQDAFSFVEKCHDLAQSLRRRLTEKLKGMYGDGESGIKDYVYFCYEPKKWRFKGFKCRIYIGTGFFAEQQKTQAFVKFQIKSKQLTKLIIGRRRFRKRANELKEAGWTFPEKEFDGSLWRTFALTAGGIEQNVNKLEQEIIDALRELQAGRLVQMLKTVKRRMDG